MPVPFLTGCYDQRGLAALHHSSLSSWASLRSDEWDLAITDLDAVLAQSPEDARALLLRGTAHQRRDDLDQAIGDRSEALRLERQLIEAYAVRGLAYAQPGEQQKADDDLSQVNQLTLPRENDSAPAPR